MDSNQLKEALEVCWGLGQKAALARQRHDEATCKFHTDYMRRFVDARPVEFKTQLRAQFDQAYRAESESHMAGRIRQAWADGKM